MSSMPSTPAGNAGIPAQVWVTGPAGCRTPASAAEAARLAAEDSFAWIDLQETGDAGLRQISEVLHLGAEVFQMLQRADPRPAFTPLADATYAALPVVNTSALAAGPRPAYVDLALTKRFLLTRHSVPCETLQETRDRYDSLPEDAKTNGPAVLFMVLDRLILQIEPLLLSLGARLDDIQLILLTSSAPQTHDEIVTILRTLTKYVQGLNWYSGDLDDAADTIGQPPGVSELFGRHRALVSRMRDAAQGYRDEAKDVLGQYASNVANRQGQAINVLTVVATLFLPLTFLSGFFGMNFGVIVNDLNATWVFVVLGLLLPAASVAITLLLWRRLLRRFGVGKLAEPGSHADGGGDSGQTLTAPTLPAPPPSDITKSGRNPSRRAAG
jgi:magnesium transporter